MDIARDIDTLRVMYALMAVTHTRDRIVNLSFVRKDDGLRHDTLAQMRLYLPRCRRIWDDLGNDASATLNHSKDGSLATPPVP